MPYIIAGVDPGATVGIAILTLSGKKIAMHSATGGMAEAARIIERRGTPSLIACDVSPAPEMALRLSSFFSCKLHAPNREIREEEKRQIASGAGTRNSHERDAYCAAVFAYRAHANKLRQIDSLPEISQEDKERIKHLLLKGYRLKDAFLELKAPEEGGEKPASQAKKPGQRPVSPEELRQRASFLARENANLRLMLTRLENEKLQLQKQLRLLENGVRQSLLRDSELRRLRFQLQNTLERMKMKPKRNQKQASHSSKTDDLNRLDEPKIDLEKLVTDYRKGRQKL